MTKVQLTSFAMAYLALSAAAYGQAAALRTSYAIDVSRHEGHTLHVSVAFPADHGERIVQLPTWYALYQIRDFAQYVLNLKAFSQDGSPLPMHSVDKTTWAVSGPAKAHRIEYDVRCDLPGAYGLEISADQVLLNPALALMYSPASREVPITVAFSGLPPHWSVTTALPETGESFAARNYQDLAETPFWIGTFDRATFSTGGVSVNVVIAAKHSFNKVELLRRDALIVKAETEWMGGSPLRSYLFLYSFPDAGDVEGMEHPTSTAIQIPAKSIEEGVGAADSVSAHELFHVWNVMRIRPCSMEPIDFVHEQYFETLWFSEGLTSTVTRIILLRSGLLSLNDYIDRVDGLVTSLQNTPARASQSLEDASRQVWMSADTAYNAPDRSISYYSKGELVGVLLDLAIRQDTNGRKSLRDLFQLLDRTYGEDKRCFGGDPALQKAAEQVTGTSLASFFSDYVSGTTELNYSRYLNWVGLQIVASPLTVAQPTHQEYHLVDVAKVSSTQMRHRQEWLAGQRQ